MQDRTKTSIGSKAASAKTCFTLVSGKSSGNSSYRIQSPNGNLKVEVGLNIRGQAYYRVFYGGEMLLGDSLLGFELKGCPSLKEGFKVLQTEKTTKDESWEMPWGEQQEVRDHYHQLKIFLQETASRERKLNIIFRLYDDGLGFRYEFPEQPGMAAVEITEEKSEFRLLDDHTTWWQPGDWDSYEHLYDTTKISEINATAKRDHPDLAQTYIPENAVNTPVSMRTESGLHLSFHEAALLNYSGMTLKLEPDSLLFTSHLVGSENRDYKVKRKLPFHTPWRSIQISENASGLIESRLILNLNEPNKLGDVSWFQPMKYAGIWWEMHLGKTRWDRTKKETDDSGEKIIGHGKHGATTENAKSYIDFAAANGIRGILVEGWNTGWESWREIKRREGIFDFVTAYPDYDLEEVVAYGKQKGVELIMHHETSAAPRTYEAQLDAAFELMRRLDLHVVKTGYVGKIIPEGEYHHGQWMVNHHRKVSMKAAEYGIAVNAHEPIKDTGLRRTYPNIITREGLRGQEFNAWAGDGGNPPEHLSIVAFTRMLAGPIDYTPGIFNIKFDEYKAENQVNTTLAHQLALYVVIYSPLQMVADLPESYRGNPAFQFIRDVGADWRQSRVLNGEIGDFVSIAREERQTGNWFLGSITDENERQLSVDLDFLPEEVSFKAVIYEDAEDAHWDRNPTAIKIRSRIVRRADRLQLKLASGGGAAVSFEKLNKTEVI